MELNQLIESYENKATALLHAGTVAQRNGDVQRAIDCDAERIGVESLIAQLRVVNGQEPSVPVPASLGDLATKVAEILKPTAETVPDELKTTIRNTVSFLDTVVDGDGITFFGKGLTADKKAEVKLVQDELSKWAK